MDNISKGNTYKECERHRERVQGGEREREGGDSEGRVRRMLEERG